MQNDKNFRPDRIGAYFHIEWLPLALVTVSGLIYNIGLLATPWFEGRLAQCLTDILDGSATAAAMAILVLTYVLVTLVVQAARFIKRFYVRRFANNINRRMKGILYANLVRQSRAALEKEGAGELMTKAISDVDDCVEGMRKFTTEIFDTGVALVGYTVMLLVYDWRLALLCLLFTPVSYICAAWMKKPVQREGAACKKAAGALSAATLDRAQNAATYRIYGCETAREAAVRGRADHLRKDRRAQQRVAVGPAAAVSGGVRSGRAVHSVVRCQKRAGHRLAGLGHCGVYYVPLLLYQADSKVVEGSEAVQRSAESRGLLEAHQAADETAGGAGRAGCARPAADVTLEDLSFAVYRRADFCRAGSDSPPGGDHRHYGAGGLRKIHFWACIFV